MPQPTCLQLKIQLAEIQDLFREFDLTLRKVRETKQTEHLIEMQKELGGKIEDLQKEFLSKEIREKIQDWQDFYRDVFQMEVNFFKIKIPEKQEGFEKLLIMAPGLDAQKIFDKCGEFFATSDADLSTVRDLERATDSAYAVWIRDRVEADEENKNLSADEIEEMGMATQALREHLLQELEYFKKTGAHLDRQKVTLCAGSRNGADFVPIVFWHTDNGNLSVVWYCSDDAVDFLRARQVVS